MINLHSFIPDPIFLDLGPIKIYWYGFFIVLGILAALTITIKLAAFYNIKKETIIDLTFYALIAGIIGARVYDVLLEYKYYFHNPLDIFKIWNGGLAIHGAIIGGTLAVWLYVRKNKLNFWQIGALAVPGLALAQAIGRWGNYFNQELYGKPSVLPWSIPIELEHRLVDYSSYNYFHPTFLYESIGSLFIFFVLIYLHYSTIKQKLNFQFLVFFYLILYSSLRFSIEFLRIDPTLIFFGFRFPQLVSIIIIAFSIICICLPLITKKKAG